MIYNPKRRAFRFALFAALILRIPSKKRAVGFGCRKRFLCPEAVRVYRERAKKRLEAQNIIFPNSVKDKNNGYDRTRVNVISVIFI